MASVILLFLAGTASVQADVPLVACDARSHPILPCQFEVAGQIRTGWQTSPQTPELRFLTQEKPTSSPDSPVYLKVTYLDHGYGRLAVTGEAEDDRRRQPDKATHLVLLDTGRLVDAYFRFPNLPAGMPDFRVRLDHPASDALTVTAVTLQTEPFPDPHLHYLLDEAWRRPYHGPTAPNANGTLRGKVMVGYQGWFRTPNDPYDAGWVHWGDIAHGTFSVDMWPDDSLYPPEAVDKAAQVRTRSGQAATLFSPGWPETVDKHFALMRRYDIDGAFVQRFVSRHNLHALGGGPEWVLGNVRAAANREGRLWAVEYDVSGCPDDELLDSIKRDWAWLVDEFGLREDAAYAREGTRPVVFVWGMPFADRHIRPATADAVVDFLKNDPVYGGNYVIGGIPLQWRTLDADWQRQFARYDAALAWQSQDYVHDLADMKRLGVTCYPHVWPGFSWANLKHLPTDSAVAYTPREGGKYYEDLLSSAVQAGADRLFVGMFDEYDEGTAILPMSDDPPPTPTSPGVNLRSLAEGAEEHSVNVHLAAVDLTFDGLVPHKGIPATDCTLGFDGEIISPVGGHYTVRVEGTEGDQADLRLGTTHLKVGAFPDKLDPALSVTLARARPIPFHLDYQHGRANGRLRLSWEPPGQAEQPVPAAAYLEAWGRFLTNEGQSADRWLALTAKWKRELSAHLSAPVTGPTSQAPP